MKILKIILQIIKAVFTASCNAGKDGYNPVKMQSTGKRGYII